MLFLSDITSPNGKHIEDASYAGDRQKLQSYKLADSVNQAKPNEKAWAEWRKCLNSLCHRTHSHTLKEPLGAWTVPPREYARDWALLYSAMEDAMYSSNDIDYSVHRRLRHNYDKDSEEYTKELPLNAVPIKVKETPHTWIRPSLIVPQDILPRETDVINTVTDLVDTLHPWEPMLLLETSFLQPEADVWRQLCTGQCFAASDGSAPHGKGLFAWVLSNTMGQQLA